jgi:hypothetical protein
MFGGRSEAGVKDINEDLAQISTGITQFGWTLKASKEDTQILLVTRVLPDSLGDPAGTLLLAQKSRRQREWHQKSEAARITAAANAEATVYEEKKTWRYVKERQEM